ncbi:MAG TPA: sugar ABC transporter substrate-binding protein [Phycisphaeraceae bacterium]
MRPSTLGLFAGLILALTGLTLSIAHHRRPSGSGPRLITFTAWGAAEEIDQLQRLVIDPINARQQRFRLQLIPIPNDYHTKLTTMMAGGAAPDLFYLSQEYVPAFAAQGALLDLTDRVAQDPRPVTDLRDYYPSVLDIYRHQGRLYGLPWIAQPIILYCNAALFRQAGVPLPTPDWRWDDFIHAGQQLTRDVDGDGRIDQWGFIVNGWPPFAMFAWQNGGDLIDATGTASLSDPKTIEALDFYAGLIHRDRIAPPLSLVSEAGFSDLFRAGKVAMFMGGAADDLDRLPGLEVVAAQVPAGPTGLRATFAWTAGLHISRHTADPDLAFEAWAQVLDGIQHWKAPAPRRSLAQQIEQIDPRKAAAAPVIRAAMAYMRTPPVLDQQVQWDTRVSEELIDPLLRTGRPAAELIASSPFLRSRHEPLGK